MSSVFGSRAQHRLGHDGLNKGRSKLITGLIALAVLVLIITVVFAIFKLKPETTGVKSDLYQAVVLSNGQVYFGKIIKIDEGYTYLKNVFYPERPSEELQKENPDTSTVLIKLGNEIHGPEDQMMIRNEQVLYYENLKPTGQVTKKINEYYAQAKN